MDIQRNNREEVHDLRRLNPNKQLLTNAKQYPCLNMLLVPMLLLTPFVPSDAAGSCDIP